MKVAIIGAGTLGLTLAYRLAKAEIKVTVFEMRSQVGGFGTWFDYGEFIWDKFYHVILQQDSHFLGLIEELGLTSKLRWKTTKSGFLWRGRLISMSNNWEFLTFPALSFFDKVRLATGILYSARLRNVSRLDTITAREWLSRMFGNRVFDSIWEPLLRSKFGLFTDKVPASFIWATIMRYYATRRRGSGKERMGYLNGGLKSLYKALMSSIRSFGGEILCNCPVVSIRDSNHKKVTLRTKEASMEFDLVISTIPSPLFQPIWKELSDQETSYQSPPYYLGIICVALILRRSLSPFYLTNLIQKGLPFTGMVEMTNVVDRHEATCEYHLVFLPRYDISESEWFEKDPDDITVGFLTSLRGLWPTIDQDIVGTVVHREKYFQPLWSPGYYPSASAALNLNGNVSLINAELIKQDTHNNNATIKIANQAADYLTVRCIR